jgi:hypothetical protein
MKSIILVFVLLAAAVFLPGCAALEANRGPAGAPHALPTLAPTIRLVTAAPARTLAQALDPACLVGTWQVSDLPRTIAESMAGTGEHLALETVEGHALVTFDAQGGMRLQYQDLTAVFTGTVNGRQVRVAQTLNGSGTARYQADPAAGQVLLSDFGGDGIRSALAINGQVLAEGNLPVWQAFAGGLDSDTADAGQPVSASRAAAACAGDALVLQMLEPSAGAALQLVRIP